MKKIQRFLRGTALLAVLSLLVSATAFAASVPDPTSDFYVNDYVGVLSGDTKSDIVSKNDGLYNATGAQIVVTVVQDTGGVSMEQYAYDMANAWGIGSAEKNQRRFAAAFRRGRRLPVYTGQRAGNAAANQYAQPHFTGGPGAGFRG